MAMSTKEFKDDKPIGDIEGEDGKTNRKKRRLNKDDHV